MTKQIVYVKGKMFGKQGCTNKDLDEFFDAPESTTKVYVRDLESNIDAYVPLDDVKVTNTSENFYGEDVVDFEYQGKEYTSKVYLDTPY